MILERNEMCLKRNQKCLERNETPLARNEMRCGNLLLSSTVLEETVATLLKKVAKRVSHRVTRES